MDADTTHRVEHAEAAEASLMARLEELARRFASARETFDLRARIGEHPFVAVGAALALGALVGLRKPDRGSEKTRGALGAAMGALVMQIAKDYAMRRILDGAMRWWGGGEREVDASHDPSIESVLEH